MPRSNDDAFDRFLGREHPGTCLPHKWEATDVLRDDPARPEASRPSRTPSGTGTRNRWCGRSPPPGLDAIEVFHPDHGPEEEARFGALAHELDLLVTAGSDFHGTPEGRKHPGGVTGTAEMLGLLRTRAHGPAMSRGPSSPAAPAGRPSGSCFSAARGADDVLYEAAAMTAARASPWGST